MVLIGQNVMLGLCILGITDIIFGGVTRWAIHPKAGNGMIFIRGIRE